MKQSDRLRNSGERQIDRTKLISPPAGTYEIHQASVEREESVKVTVVRWAADLADQLTSPARPQNPIMRVELRSPPAFHP
ncbi:hypothetical protein [Amycolatopsis sp. lyj-90]|uniref:hypothetical protein n=1 Tax=Amycolatopsis sp. lyj-90 TaxID=2789285 RepID=UPI00397BE1B7